jgi:hypothetical protein
MQPPKLENNNNNYYYTTLKLDEKIQNICMKAVLDMGALAFLVLLKWLGI